MNQSLSLGRDGSVISSGWSLGIKLSFLQNHLFVSHYHTTTHFPLRFSRHTHDKVMAAHQIPEILRVPLEGLVLQVRIRIPIGCRFQYGLPEICVALSAPDVQLLHAPGQVAQGCRGGRVLCRGIPCQGMVWITLDFHTFHYVPVPRTN